ncbi:MAG: hypothetical protein H7Z15_10670, partial [Rhizobacter sp.]|nr:hypothetical protein [Rhizobacter sp.]
MSFFAVGPAAAQFSYQFTDLGALWGAASQAHGINDQGQVVGYSVTSQTVTALLWTGGAVTALPHLAGQYSTAVDINNHGVIVGGIAFGGYYRPAVWRNGVVEQLSRAGGGVTPEGVANSINDAGVVSGTTSFRDHPLQIFSYSTAVTWDASGVRTELPDNSPYAAGLAINAAGQVAGYIGFPSGGSTHNLPSTLPTTWMPAYSTQTGLIWDARANDINDRGQFVGTTGVPSGGSPAHPRAILWHDGMAVDLGQGTAHALNEAAQIVGHSGSTFSAGMRATLWHDGTTLDLNT